MHIKPLLMLGFLLFFSLPAFAFHCPMDMKKIDAALATNPSLSQEQLAQVQKLRGMGEQYHKAGDHQRSVEVLGQAMQILQIQ